MRGIKKIFFSLLTITVIIFCAIGAYGIAAAPPEKDSGDLNQLKKELENNEKQLNQQKTADTSADVYNKTNNGSQKDDSLGTENSKNSADSITKSEIPEKNNESQNITLIGDSVMLGASPEVQKKMPGCIIDAKESRQVTKGIEIVQKLDSNSRLKDTVVIGLGTNGPFSRDDGQKLLDYLGSKRKVYWITSYGRTLGWKDSVNKTIRKLVQDNSNVKIIDWASQGESHPEWFYSDGIHLNKKGQTAYADFIVSNLGL